MWRRSMKIAGMTSSSKRGRTSSTKKSGADDARVMSVKRADILPRTGVASAARRKPIAAPSLDAPTEAPATEVAAPKKRVRRLEQTENVAGRTRAPRVAGRASVKPASVKPSSVKAGSSKSASGKSKSKKAAAKEVTPTASGILAELQPVAASVGAAEPATAANDESATTVLEAPAVGALAAVETEMVVEASAILEETIIAMPVASAPPPERRGLVRTVSRLLASLLRLTGPRL